MPKLTYSQCEHRMIEPGDAYVPHRQLSALRRIVRCIFCDHKRVEVYEYGRWKPITQLGFWQ